MSDAWQYAVWPDPMSRSRALESRKFGHFQRLSSPPFTMGAGKWPQIRKSGHNTWNVSGRILNFCPSFCVTWLWSQVGVDHQSRTGLICWYMSVCVCVRRAVAMSWIQEWKPLKRVMQLLNRVHLSASLLKLTFSTLTPPHLVRLSRRGVDTCK